MSKPFMNLLYSSEHVAEGAYATAARARQEAALAELGTEIQGGQIERLEQQVAQLETQLFGLGLYTRTILQLLVDANVLTTEAFTEKMNELDLLDGKLDGR